MFLRVCSGNDRGCCRGSHADSQAPSTPVNQQPWGQGPGTCIHSGFRTETHRQGAKALIPKYRFRPGLPRPSESLRRAHEHHTLRGGGGGGWCAACAGQVCPCVVGHCPSHQSAHWNECPFATEFNLVKGWQDPAWGGLLPAAFHACWTQVGS